ncbi:hypothetical protein CW705_08650 [Candidatus Bathyarchaeota archaeon]|nr:MAG: hypothetical protein CW705_08650 [Candidatus Bathyarchaeota archaeon]
MEILIQKNISEPSSRKVFAQISTQVLTLEDVIRSISSVIDDEKQGYRRLPFINARSESIQRLDIYTSLRKTRADKAFILSNGRNTIYMLDYVVKVQRVYHDPVLCIIGPEAEEIAQLALKRLSRILLSKMYEIRFNDEAIRDFSNMMRYKKAEVLTHLSSIFEEAEIALKMRLLKDHESEGEHKIAKDGLSKELLEEIRHRPISAKPFDLRDIIPFLATSILTIILLILLLRL